MNVEPLLHLSILFFHLNLIICATVNFDAEVKIFFEVEGIQNPSSREKALARKLIFERQRVDNLNVKIGELKNEKNSLQRVHIRLSPRALVDSVEETYESEYHEIMNSYQQKIEELKKEQKDLSGTITHLQNEIKNPKVSPDRVKSKTDLITTHTERLNKIPREISNLENKLPQQMVNTTKNTRSNRIAKRKHFWNLIMENKRDDRNVKKIWKYIQKWYNLKPASFREKTSLTDYVDHFCEVMGTIHELASNDAAHVVGRFHLRPGFEFKVLRVYGADDLDEFTTILVNAVGLSHLFGDTLDVDGLLLPAIMKGISG